MTWRDQAAPIIRAVLEKATGRPESAIRQALYEAYPFGQRQYHPYKIWLDEIRRQRGTKPPLGTHGVGRMSGVGGEDDPNQMELWP